MVGKHKVAPGMRSSRRLNSHSIANIPAVVLTVSQLSVPPGLQPFLAASVQGWPLESRAATFLGLYGSAALASARARSARIDGEALRRARVPADDKGPKSMSFSDGTALSDLYLS